MKYTALTFTLYLGLSSSLAAAESDSTSDATRIGTPVPGLSQTGFGMALSDSTLSDQRGKATITSKNDLDASVHRNVATDTISGSNYISDGAFTDSTGVFAVIQNSGNNVLIQSATILNMDIK